MDKKSRKNLTQNQLEALRKLEHEFEIDTDDRGHDVYITSYKNK